MPQPRTRQARRRPAKTGEAHVRVTIYGIHAAEAALYNPRRTIHKVLATANAAHRLGHALGERGIAPEVVLPKALDKMLGPASVHQGVLIEAEPLPPAALSDLGAARLVLVLDQITDPHNVGAILRSAAAFGADALVMTTRNSPPLSGVLAKAASGGLEYVPVALVPNLARALDALGDTGLIRLGLDSDAPAALEEEPAHERLALVLGAEDRGLRRLTRERCDRICALATCGPIRSLNVSNAAAIALYQVTREWCAKPVLR